MTAEHTPLPVDNPLGVAVVGLGNWSYQLGRAIKRAEGVKLLSCYTRTPEKREKYAATFGCARASTLQSLFETPGLEAVVLATPAHTHAELTFACARRGLHVLVEKPMALSLSSALRMRAACHKYDVVLMVGHEIRRLGGLRAVKALLEEHALGQVVSATASMTLSGRFDPDNWRCHRDTNRGGALIQLGIHQIENFNYLFGRPLQVRGQLTNAIAPNDVHDVGVAIITYPGGVQAIVSATYVSPSSLRLSLFGDRANLHHVADMRAWPDAAAVDGKSELILEDGQKRRQVPITPRDALREQFEDFARSVRHDLQPETGADEGLWAVAVVECVLRVTLTGGTLQPGQLIQTVEAKGTNHES